MSSSSSSCQSGALVPYDAGGPQESSQFPAGLRVLLVDDDGVCLRVVAQMLKFFQYQVTTCNRAVDALETLRQREQEFDLILSDLHMPDMDGFKLLEHVGLEMDLPVIMMSADEGTNVVMKGIKHGACDYLIKPVSMEALKNIWQHVVRKKKSDELKETENSESAVDGDKQKKRFEETDYTSSNEGNWKNLKRSKDGKEEEVEEERDDSSATKKQRVVWSMELHKQFVEAVKNLGVEKAVPKKILEMMNVPGLTRENVASHLQKYRLYLRRVHTLQNPNRVDTRCSGTSEAQAYSFMSSLDQYSLQGLAASGYMPPQSALTVPSGSSRVTNANINMPIAGQKAFFDLNVHSSKLRSSVGQPVTNRHMGLNGLPTHMEPGQFGIERRQLGFLPPALNASSSFSHGAINGHLNNSSVMQIPQCGQHISLSHQQPRGYLVNANVREHDPGEQILSSGVLSQFWGGNGTTASGEESPPQGIYMNNPYDTSQALYAANYQSNCGNGSVGNSHPFVSSTGASNIKPTSMIQTATSATESSKNASGMKWVKPLCANYDMTGDLHQSQDWKLQNVNLSYGSAQLLGPKQSHIDVGSSISTPQDFNAILKDRTGRNTCTFVKKVFSITAEIEPQKVVCVPQHNGAVRAENPCTLKEVVPDPIFQDEFDPMDVVGFQQELGFGEDEHALGLISPFEA